MHTLLNQQSTPNVGVGLDVGRARAGKPNQDSLGIYSDYCQDSARLATNGRLYAVADGMGGAAGGQQASQLAIQALMTSYYGTPIDDIRASLLDAIQHANSQIHTLGRSDSELKGMGTTIVAAVLHNDTLVVANAGDSRAYIVRDGTLTQLSTDHSLVQEQVRQGNITSQQANQHPQRNVILRNLGHEPRAQPDITHTTVQNGDVLVLCSDGLWGMVSNPEIAQVVQEQSPADATQTLIERANAAGGTDNIAVIILSIDVDLAQSSKPQPATTPESDTQPDLGTTAVTSVDTHQLPVDQTNKSNRLLWVALSGLLLLVLVLGSILSWNWWHGTPLFGGQMSVPLKPLIAALCLISL